MQKLVLISTVLCLCAVANAITLPDKAYLSSGFSDFQAKFGKKYNGSEELSYRQALYTKNMDAIKKFNSNNGDWQMGENAFTDMSAEERQMFLGLNKNPEISTQNEAAAKAASSTEEAQKSAPVLSGQVSWTSFTPSSWTFPSFPSFPVVPVTPSTNGGSSSSNSSNSSSSNSSNSSSSNTSNNSASNTSNNSSNSGNTSGSTTVQKTGFDALQQNVNWSTAGVMTAVKNQKQCGACYTFAANALVEALYKQKFKTEIDLSEQDLINCSSNKTYGNSGCNGGLISNALEYIKQNGVHLDATIPYTQSLGSCTTTSTTAIANIAAVAGVSTSKAVNAGVRIADYQTVGNQSLLGLLTALQKAPVAIAIQVVDSLYSYSKGLYPASSCPVASYKGQQLVNHAVLAVGYSLTGDSTTGNKPYILIKNSWGTNWGEAGLFKLEITKTDVGDGPCQITVANYNYAATLL